MALNMTNVIFERRVREAGGSKAREASDSTKLGREPQDHEPKILLEPAERATARWCFGLWAIARFAGSIFISFVILGLAPQALRFRPLRGLGAAGHMAPIIPRKPSPG